MDDSLTITSVLLDGSDGVLIGFSDCTVAGYVAEELLDLRPLRESRPSHLDHSIDQVDMTSEGLVIYFDDGRVAILHPATLYNMIDYRSEYKISKDQEAEDRRLSPANSSQGAPLLNGTNPVGSDL